MIWIDRQNLNETVILAKQIGQKRANFELDDEFCINLPIRTLLVVLNLVPRPGFSPGTRLCRPCNLMINMYLAMNTAYSYSQYGTELACN